MPHFVINSNMKLICCKFAVTCKVRNCPEQAVQSRKSEKQVEQRKASIFVDDKITLIDVQCIWIAASQFLFKINYFFDSRQRNKLQLKRSASRKIISSGKLNAKMASRQVFSVFRAGKYHRLYR